MSAIFYLVVVIMTDKMVTVTNSVGLHARAATLFIQKANIYKGCSIWIENDNRRVNAKSLLGVLSLGIVRGMQIKIVADGDDEAGAVEGLCRAIEVDIADKA